MNKRLFPEPVNERMWTTRDGTRMRMADMTVQHLYNAFGTVLRAALEAYAQQDHARHARNSNSLDLLVSEFKSRNLSYDHTSYSLVCERGANCAVITRMKITAVSVMTPYGLSISTKELIMYFKNWIGYPPAPAPREPYHFPLIHEDVMFQMALNGWKFYPFNTALDTFAVQAERAADFNRLAAPKRGWRVVKVEDRTAAK